MSNREATAASDRGEPWSGTSRDTIATSAPQAVAGAARTITAASRSVRMRRTTAAGSQRRASAARAKRLSQIESLRLAKTRLAGVFAPRRLLRRAARVHGLDPGGGREAAGARDPVRARPRDQPGHPGLVHAP